MPADLYATLSVSRTATPEEIKAAYRKLAKEVHPDKHLNETQDVKKAMAEKFNRIQQAYEVLADGNRRRVYDREGRSAAMSGRYDAAGTWARAGERTEGYKDGWSDAQRARYFYQGGARARPSMRDMLWTLLRMPTAASFSKSDALFHAGIAATLVVGYNVAFVGNMAWSGANDGKSFDEAMERVKRARRVKGDAAKAKAAPVSS